MQIQFLPCDAIYVGPRQRTEAPEAHIKELANDILANGLLHAISVDKNGDLVAGACRLAAIKSLNQPYMYGTESVQAGLIPVIMLSHTDQRVIFRVELMENLRRKNLSPLDEAKAVAELHRMFKEERGEDWSKADTGHELDKMRSEVKTTMKGELRSNEWADKEVADAILLEGFANDPDVAKAKTRTEAVGIAKRKLEQELVAGLGAMQVGRTLDMEVIIGPCEGVLPTYQPNVFDGILADPPYGIGADDFGEQTMKSGHQYEDTPESGLAIAATIFNEGFRVCKPDAHLYMFCDIRLWPSLISQARAAGWYPYPTPLMWHKPGAGHAPQVGYFTRRYETILFATKGNRTLSKSHSDVFEYPPVKDKIHAAQKPVDLLAELLALSFFPGEHVLDPCCGAGTIFKAAHKTKIRASGIELDEKYYNICKQVIATL